MMKAHIIIGNKNVCSYKEVFPYFKEQTERMGYTIPNDFILPDKSISNQLKGLCRWFNNLGMKAGKKIPETVRYEEDKYKEYDNYKGIINIDKIKDIPYDYKGRMGVPITILEYDLENYKILGIADRQNTYGFRTKKYGPDDMTEYNDMNPNAVIKEDGKYKSKYSRVIIERV